jgi:hypothetical protein
MTRAITLGLVVVGLMLARPLQGKAEEGVPTGLPIVAASGSTSTPASLARYSRARRPVVVQPYYRAPVYRGPVYRAPAYYGPRTYYYGPRYVYPGYYGVPRAGYYNYGYGGGAVIVGPMYWRW